jgi:ABC-type protease/lipase transport system fused ATPase/permease subunit
VLDGGLVLLYLAILFVTSPWMGLVVVALGGLQVLVFLLSRHRQQQLMSQNLELEAKNTTYQLEMLSGIQTLKAFGVEERSVQTYSNLFVDVLNVAVARGVLSVWVDSAMSTLRMGSPVLLLLLGTWQVIHQELSTGQMLALNALAAAVLVPLANLVTTAGQLQWTSRAIPPPSAARARWSRCASATRPARLWWCRTCPCTSSPGRWWPSWAGPARASPPWPTSCWACTCPPPGTCATTAWSWRT